MRADTDMMVLRRAKRKILRGVSKMNLTELGNRMSVEGLRGNQEEKQLRVLAEEVIWRAVPLKRILCDDLF